MGGMNAIWEAGTRIPEDIALIGACNLPFDEPLRVPLSSIDQASQPLGERAATLTLKLMGSKDSSRTRTILLPPTPLVRASTSR